MMVKKIKATAVLFAFGIARHAKIVLQNIYFDFLVHSITLKLIFFPSFCAHSTLLQITFIAFFLFQFTRFTRPLAGCGQIIGCDSSWIKKFFSFRFLFLCNKKKSLFPDTDTHEKFSSALCRLFLPIFTRALLAASDCMCDKVVYTAQRWRHW